MRERWVNKNVDLKRLVDLIRSFLNSHGLGIEKEEFKEESRLFLVKGRWGKSGAFKFRLGRSRRIQICIRGHSNDFTVELDTDAIERGFRSSRIIGRFLSLFGGGIILLESLRAQEDFYAWQERFWRFVTEQVANLTNSGIEVRNFDNE